MAGLPPAEVEAWIRAIEQAGVIREYPALVNWERADIEEVASIIELKVSPECDFGKTGLLNGCRGSNRSNLSR